MAHFVKVAAVQFNTKAKRGAPDAHATVLDETQKALKNLEGYGLDLVVTCEGVESIGQSIEQAEGATQPGPYLKAYANFAKKERCHVAGSIKLREGNKVYNSIAYLGPDGDYLGAYHKVNLTPPEIERGLTSGPGPVVIETKIGRIGGAICFDLNFLEIRQAYEALKPDILTFPSAYHGGLMQGAWAYFCRSFFVSALPMEGSGILDPFGRPVDLTHCYTNVAMATINLDRVMVHLDFNRKHFSEIRKKYQDEVRVDVPPHIGCALIYSLTEKRTAMDIVTEFDLELLDDYFDRALAGNAKNRA